MHVPREERPGDHCGHHRAERAGRPEDTLRGGRASGRRSASDDRVEGRTEKPFRDTLEDDHRDDQDRVRERRVQGPRERHPERAQHDERHGTVPVRPAPRQRRDDHDAEAERREREPDEADVGAQPGHPEAPDHVVGADGEVAAQVHDERCHQETVPEGGGRAGGWIQCGITGGDMARHRAAKDGEGEQDRSACHGGRAEDEGKSVAAAQGRPDAAEGGSQQEATHLGRPIEPERRSTPGGGRGVQDVGARRRVVGRRREAGEPPSKQERRGAGHQQRHRHDGRGGHHPDEHQQALVAAVGEHPEERLADQAGGGPRGHDPAERRGVDPVLGQVERQHREQRPEPQPQDRLGDQDGQDREGRGKPPADTLEGGGRHAGHRTAGQARRNRCRAGAAARSMPRRDAGPACPRARRRASRSGARARARQ